jgi:hypothetical protein
MSLYEAGTLNQIAGFAIQSIEGTQAASDSAETTTAIAPRPSSETLPPPFDSIESAQDFLNVLAETILVEIKDINRDHKIAVQDDAIQRAQALSLALYKLKTLSSHVQKSRRILNDLRMLRERLGVERVLWSRRPSEEVS